MKTILRALPRLKRMENVDTTSFLLSNSKINLKTFARSRKKLRRNLRRRWATTTL